MKLFYLVSISIAISAYNNHILAMGIQPRQDPKLSIMNTNTEDGFRALISQQPGTQSLLLLMQAVLEIGPRNDALWLQKVEALAGILSGKLHELTKNELLAMSQALDKSRHLWIGSSKIEFFSRFRIKVHIGLELYAKF